MQTIDTWLVARYRGVQLLPDSVIGGAPLGDQISVTANATANAEDAQGERATATADAAYPRVESVIATAVADTLLALQFGAQTGRAPLAAGATVRLSGPTGAISAATGRIVARRAFRTPSTPAMGRTEASAWRYGWAYVAVVTRSDKRAASSGFRSWMLMESVDSARRK
jgi:hypothetical protein